MPSSPRFQGSPSKKKSQSLLGNMFGKIHASGKKKTPASKQHVCAEGDGEDLSTKRSLFSFSPSRVPKSTVNATTSSRKSAFSTPVRLFSRIASQSERHEELIPARHSSVSSIKVIVRVRPRTGREQHSKPCLTVSSREEGRNTRIDGTDTLSVQSGSGESLVFGFDRVLGEDKDQEDVYNASGSMIVENCLQGFNGCLLAYGQTGSGKTYSMMGNQAQDSGLSRGLIQRAFEDLLSRVESKNEQHALLGSEFECSISCSFIEIYNESITDLTTSDAGSLAIRDDPEKGIYVSGVRWHHVRSVEDVQSILALGISNRRVAETMANDRSSRSHSVFTANIQQRFRGTVLRSRLHLVDLAGSERQKSSGAAGERLKEASSINKSLSALGHVIMSLVDVQQGKKRHIPYRDSKLTFLLQDALGGTAKTVLLATVSPAGSNSFETLSTLRFADNVKRIKNKAVVNQDAEGDAAWLRKEVVRLRQELADAMQRVDNPMPDSGMEGAVDISNDNASQKALIAALTREEKACVQVAALQEELDATKELVDAKEADLQRTKMMLRLKESRISQINHTGSAKFTSSYGAGDQDLVNQLENEIALLKQKIETHPEVKKFALENIRLRRQLERLADGGQAPASSAHPATQVSPEEFAQLRSELIDMTSRADRALSEVHMLRAEAVAAKQVLRTAEKRRCSVDALDKPVGEPSDPDAVASLQKKLDDFEVLMEAQRSKVAEYDKMCAHAGKLDLIVDSLSKKCERLEKEVDEWYDAYTDALKSIVGGWSLHAEMESTLSRMESSISEERAKHAESNHRAKARISEAMKSASLLNEELLENQKRISTLDLNLSQARTQATESQARAVDLQAKYQSTLTEVSDLQTTVSKYCEEISELKSTAGRLEDHVATLENAQHDANAEAAQKDKELKSTRAALASAQIDFQMIQSQLKDKTKELAFSQESETELRASIIQLQDALAASRSAAEKVSIEHDGMIAVLKNDLASQKQECAHHVDQSNLKNLERENASLQAQIKALEGRLSESQSVSNSGAGPMGQEAQARDYKNVTQKLSEAEEMVTKLHQDIHSLRAQVKAKDDIVAKLRNQMAMEVNDAAQQVQELLAAQARADLLERQLSQLLDREKVPL
jgi:predicted  nucleic acid-binding Zn-ribbon protein